MRTACFCALGRRSLRPAPKRAPIHGLPPAGPRRGAILRERTSNRTTLVLLTIIASCSAVWSLASRFVVPHVIERAYYGKSWQIFDRLVTGQASHPLAEYISAWNGIAWRVELGFILLGLCLVVLIRPEFQRAFWGPEPSAYPGRFKAPEEKKERRCENRSAVDRKDESPHRFGSGHPPAAPGAATPAIRPQPDPDHRRPALIAAERRSPAQSENVRRTFARAGLRARQAENQRKSSVALKNWRALARLARVLEQAI